MKGDKVIPVLDLGCHGHEGLLNVGGVLGTGLQEGDADLVSKGLQQWGCCKARPTCAWSWLWMQQGQASLGHADDCKVRLL